MADEATQNYTLSTNQMRAARLTAEDELADEDIAVECGITRKSLWSWRQRDDFKALVTQHRETFLNRALEEGFADKRRRVKALNSVGTALLTQMASADNQILLRMTDEGIAIYGFDKDRVAQFRGCLDDIAKEMGERKAVTELSGPNKSPIPIRIVEVIPPDGGAGDDPGED